jgi:hypothetical protein
MEHDSANTEWLGENRNRNSTIHIAGAVGRPAAFGLQGAQALI